MLSAFFFLFNCYLAKVSINIPSIYKVNTPFKRNDYKMQKIFCLLVATTWILAKNHPMSHEIELLAHSNLIIYWNT